MNRKQRDANRQTARDARLAVLGWTAGSRKWQKAALPISPESATIDALCGKSLFAVPSAPRMQELDAAARRSLAHLSDIFGTSSAPDPLPAKILLRATPFDIVPGPFLMAWDESDRPVEVATTAAEGDVASFRYIDAPAKEPT